MSEQPSPPSPVNWRRGLHRVFAVLCVLWVLWVFVGFPHRISQDRLAFYGKMLALHHAQLPEGEGGQAKKEQEDRRLKEEFGDKAWLPNVYKHDVWPNLHWFLLACVAVPAVFYGIARAALALVLWLCRGFKSPSAGRA